jgi:hypothetical protein
LVSFGIYSGNYKLTDVESGLDKVWVIPSGLCDP